jgi:hypothetical protein
VGSVVGAGRATTPAGLAGGGGGSVVVVELEELLVDDVDVDELDEDEELDDDEELDVVASPGRSGSWIFKNA